MTKRIFLAIDLPQSIKDQIAKLQHGLPMIALGDLHIALNFLGKLPHQDINEVIKLIQLTTAKHFSFKLKPQFLETLYKKHDDSIVYLSLGDEVDRLKDLQKDLSKALDDVAAQPQRYMPLISIGKLKKMDPDSTKKALNKILDLDLAIQIDEFMVDKITLFESILHGDSATYQRIRDFKLGVKLNHK